MLRALNPDALIVPITRGQVPLEQVLDTGRFDFERASLAPGWLKEMRGEHVPETEEYGISSFTYTARRPFHPARFHAFLNRDWDNGKLLRSKGYFWLATRPRLAGTWSQAGGIAHHGVAGFFWKAVPEHNWPDDAETRAFIREKWHEPFGDMRQELVFIGQGMDPAHTRRALDACLLSDDETRAGLEYWRTLADPFPDWGLEEAS